MTFQKYLHNRFKKILLLQQNVKYIWNKINDLNLLLLFIIIMNKAVENFEVININDYRKDFKFIIKKIKYNKVISNLRYKNINFCINCLIFSNVSIISYLLYKK
jgi:hypothetical protein